jgi:hypothetical protein
MSLRIYRDSFGLVSYFLFPSPFWKSGAVAVLGLVTYLYLLCAWIAFRRVSGIDLMDFGTPRSVFPVFVAYVASYLLNLYACRGLIGNEQPIRPRGRSTWLSLALMLFPFALLPFLSRL